ncbi:MAG: hypothetical protein LBS25_09515, partial [Candidatus Symbiothrix sp.]|nr:hypothetical protein [Candidatus Symbiothrix sp.]
MKRLTFLSAAILLANVLNATVFYIVPGGAGNKTGVDWENAADLSTTTLALGNNGDEFWVKAGTYQPTDFKYANRKLYGGFAGAETTLMQRDWVKNQTVIQGIDNATLPLVIMQASTVPNVLDGFIIQDNHITENGQNGGGVNMNGNSVLRNCIIRNNSSFSNANVGGGVFIGNITNATPLIENCLVINNATKNNGGGIQVANNMALNIKNSTVANNMITKETSEAGSGFGCGIGLPVNAVMVAENCIVYNNQKPDGQGTLTFSFGANHNTNNNALSTVKNCAYDAINAGTGTQGGVVFTSKTACIDDLSTTKTPGFTLSTTFAGNSTSDDERQQIINADYRLTEGSVCIDTGGDAAASGITNDLANINRSFGNAVDIGAYEYAIDLVISENASCNASEYTSFCNNIVFNAGSQLTDATNMVVKGKVRIVKTFEAGKWYPIGFPFAIESISIKQGENVYEGHIYGLDNDAEVVENPTNQSEATIENIYLATYDSDADKFKFTDALAANTGYVIAVPEGAFDVESTDDG